MLITEQKALEQSLYCASVTDKARQRRKSTWRGVSESESKRGKWKSKNIVDDTRRINRLVFRWKKADWTHQNSKRKRIILNSNEELYEDALRRTHQRYYEWRGESVRERVSEWKQRKKRILLDLVAKIRKVFEYIIDFMPFAYCKSFFTIFFLSLCLCVCFSAFFLGNAFACVAGVGWLFACRVATRFQIIMNDSVCMCLCVRARVRFDGPYTILLFDFLKLNLKSWRTFATPTPNLYNEKFAFICPLFY